MKAAWQQVFVLVVALLSLPVGAQTTVDLSYSGSALIYKGELDAAANQRLFALYEAATPKPTTLVISSSGGKFSEALALGEWVFAHQLAVNVPTHCHSSCANYVFTAAARRELGYHAVLGFHGGMADAERQLPQRLATVSAAQQPALRQALRDMMVRDGAREVAFFRKIGVDRRITSYGFQARYQAPMQVYGVWTYSLAMLKYFGVDNIRIHDDELWFPRPLNRGLLYITAPDVFSCIPAGTRNDVPVACQQALVMP